MWETATTDDFDRWFERLDEVIQEEVVATVRLLQSFGPGLKRPHADTLNGSKHAHMKELRIDGHDAVVRIAFAFAPPAKRSCCARETSRASIRSCSTSS